MGIDRYTGKGISGLALLRQRIESILTMRKGASPMRRSKGSNLFHMIDAPSGPQSRVDYIAATAGALQAPENGLQDFKVTRVKIISDGAVTQITLEGDYTPEGRKIKLEGIEL